MAGNNQKKILIIDDDHRNTFALNAVLKAKGFLCRTAVSAEEGLKMLTDDAGFGVILLDMMMPEMDGYEAIHLIRHQWKKSVPIISVTAQAMQGDEERCLEAGADAYISKPVDVDRLLSLLNRYL